MRRAFRVLKAKLVNLLLSDVEIEELIVKKIRAGKRTIIITPDYVDMAVLTANPTLAAGRMWMMDVGELRFTEDGATVRVAGMATHDRAYHVSPTLPTNDAHVTATPIDHPDGSVALVKLSIPTMSLNTSVAVASGARWVPAAGVYIARGEAGYSSFIGIEVYCGLEAAWLSPETSGDYRFLPPIFCTDGANVGCRNYAAFTVDIHYRKLG